MSDIDILSNMIKTTVTIPLVDDNGRKKVLLEETQCSDSSVIIYGLPENTIAIKADAFKSRESFFSGSRGECKCADFIIVADAPNKKIILCIEMKKTKGPRIGIVQQLNGAQCLALYCQEIGKAFWGQEEFLDDYKFRFISIGHISIDKHKTRIDQPSGLHDKPEKMMKIDWPRYLEFNRLAGR